jgi:hypothetical protein
LKYRARKPYTSATLKKANPTMAYQKNAKQSAALAALAKQHNISVRELMLSDEHISAVCDIFYEGLPKLARMTMKREKFQTFYLNQREKLADEMFPVKKE